MKKIMTALTITLLTAYGVASEAATREEAIQLVSQNKADLVELDNIHAKVMASEDAKRNLVNEYQAKLNNNIKMIQANLQNPAAIKAVLAQVEQTNMQVNMQFLALHEATQRESRKFQTLSNASKARHDIAMNAIRNMK